MYCGHTVEADRKENFSTLKKKKSGYDICFHFSYLEEIIIFNVHETDNPQIEINFQVLVL